MKLNCRVVLGEYLNIYVNVQNSTNFINLIKNNILHRTLNNFGRSTAYKRVDGHQNSLILFLCKIILNLYNYEMGF